MLYLEYFHFTQTNQHEYAEDLGITRVISQFYDEKCEKYNFSSLIIVIITLICRKAKCSTPTELAVTEATYIKNTLVIYDRFCGSESHTHQHTIDASVRCHKIGKGYM